MAIINLSEWNTPGAVPRSQSEQVTEFLGGLIKTKLAADQNRTNRRAAANLLGIDESQVPLGITNQDVMDLQKEAYKQKLQPQKEWKPSDEASAVRFWDATEGKKLGAKSISDTLKTVLNMKDKAAEKGSILNINSDLPPERQAEVARELLAAKVGESGGTQGTVKFDPKSFERFNDALDPTKTVRSPLGIAKIAYDKAERLQSLANAFPDGNLDSRQIEELAIGFNSLLQGGGGGGSTSERLIQGLIPKSWVGNAMKIAEFLTNNPKGTKQQEFVKRMMGTVEREKATTAAQIKRTQFSRIAAFSNLEKKDPEKFNQILLSWGIEPQEYADWKTGGYKQVNAAQAGLSGTEIPHPSAKYIKTGTLPDGRKVGILSDGTPEIINAQ